MNSFKVFWCIPFLLFFDVSSCAACNSAVICFCGSSNTTYTMCIDGVEKVVNPCHLWLYCKTCKDNLQGCASCPENRIGPTCLKDRSPVDTGTPCINPTPPPNGYIVGRPRRRPARYPPGTELTFGCQDGYRPIGAVILYCLLSGDWTSRPPRCVESQPVSPSTVTPPKVNPNCRFPGVDPNGEIEETPSINPRKFSQTFLPGTEVTYSCKNGFRMEGPSAIICLTTGKWSNPAPKCIRDSRIRVPEDPSTANCPNTGPIANGRVIVVYKNVAETRRPGEVVAEYQPGTRLEYSCEPKYTARGTSTLICLPNGDWNNDPPVCVEECGMSRMQTTRKITNGQSTSAGEWPWVVAISPARNRGAVICGGALLDRRTVLTAAHCLVDYQAFALHFGKFKRKNSEDDGEVKRAVSTRVIIHKDFNNVTFENDIALVRFEPSVRYSDRIQPVCLPTPNTTPKNLEPLKKGKVTGWGLTERKLQSDELMLASLPVQSLEECQDSYRDHGLNKAIYPGMFCAGYTQGVTSACRGDSGSPLVFADEEGRYTVEGVVSFGPQNRECGSERAYTVFTKVAHYMPWIMQNRARG
ncbi:hypothetical protein JTE90_023185 [Oedothorax gibbosus]|uniref:limulus clotting factor C n=1 Tax=Oedothorax gibbosus TaxID=931172 RepID=A0AAV6UI42_9ARAC|nr:hypothetical protein JTE90_023185 [Oedothorax gibbosus]